MAVNRSFKKNNISSLKNNDRMCYAVNLRRCT